MIRDICIHRYKDAFHNKILAHKMIVSIFFGAMGFFGALHSSEFLFANLSVNIVWSLIFPLLVTLVWGYGYGFVSLILGLSGFYPFLLWPINGWALLVPCSAIFLWVFLHGWGREKRKESNKFYFNLYFIQFIYAVCYLFLYTSFYDRLLVCNPPFWNADAVRSVDRAFFAVIVIKGLLSEFMILGICDTLLLLPFVRKFFLLKTTEISRYNTRIVLLFCLLGSITLALLLAINNFLVYGYKSLDLLLYPSPSVEINFVVVTVACIIGGGIAARFMQHFLEAQKQLGKSEAKYREIFENISDLYIETNLNGTIITVSPSVKEILGYSVQELIGENIGVLYFLPDQRVQLIEILLEEQEIMNYEVSLRGKNGDKHFLWLHGKLVARGKKKRILSIFRDVTKYMEARVQQQKSQEQFRLLYERMSNGFILLQPTFDENQKLKDLIIEHVNPAVEKLMTAPATHFIGKDWSVVFYSPYLNLYQNLLETGETQSVEYYTPMVSKFLRITAFTFVDQKIGVMVEDITAHKLAMDEINKLNGELEQRVEERTKELQEAIGELEAFSYTVSHDLKSPLRAIDGYSRIMLEDFEHILKGEPAELIENIRQISKDMIELINKMLQYSITSRLAIYSEEINIREMIIATFHELQFSQPERQMVLELEGEFPLIKVDRVLIKQVLYNLLSNGFKFTRSRELGILQIKYDICPDEIIFCIKDNGIGFDRKYVNKLFGIFQRLHANDEYEGTGIGLATVRKIIQKHGGRTWIDGEIDKGTSVYFTLPMDSSRKNK